MSETKIFTQEEADQLTQADIDQYAADGIAIEIKKDDPPVIDEVEVEPEPEVVRFNAMPGYVMVGYPEFPFETSDKKIIKFLKGSRAMRANKVWIDERTHAESDEAESALKVLSFQQLQKMVAAMGHIDVYKYSKLELLDILQKG